MTVCGTLGQANEVKAGARIVRLAVKSNKYYFYDGSSEHTLLKLYCETSKIGRTGRSNKNYTSYDLTIRDSFNKSIIKN